MQSTNFQKIPKHEMKACFHISYNSISSLSTTLFCSYYHALTKYSRTTAALSRKKLYAKTLFYSMNLKDKMIDYGYPQLTETETLKLFVNNEPIVVAAIPNTGKMINPKTASANAVHKPVIGSVNDKGKSVNQNQKNEIFVDILERLNVIFNSSG